MIDILDVWVSFCDTDSVGTRRGRPTLHMRRGTEVGSKRVKKCGISGTELSEFERFWKKSVIFLLFALLSIFSCVASTEVPNVL